MPDAQLLFAQGVQLLGPELRPPQQNIHKGVDKKRELRHGILSEVLDKLKMQVKGGVIDPHCSLFVDDMPIRKGLVYDHSDEKFIGHVDLGAGEADGSVATTALTFMAVGLKGQWCHPVAYFLTDGLASDSLAELTKSVLVALAEAGLIVKIMVANGLKANINMFSRLGANIDNKNQNPGFMQHNHASLNWRRSVLSTGCGPYDEGPEEFAWGKEGPHA